MKSHYITIFIRKQELASRNQYERLSDIYSEAKSKISDSYNYNEGKLNLQWLNENYPEMEFELKPIGD